VLVVFLKLNPRKRTSLSEVIRTFDWLGFLLLVSGIVLFLVGLASGGNGTWSWTSGVVLGTLIPGALCLVLGVVNELYTKRIPLVPPRLFKTRTTAGVLTSVLIHGIVFVPATFYLPLYFQAVNGSSATLSGVQLLPLSVMTAITATASGFIITKTGDYRWILWICWTILTLGTYLSFPSNAGMGLLIDLTYPYNVAKSVVFLLITGVGIGGLFQTPLIALQAAMPSRDMAVATGAMILFRLLGSATGIAIGGTILNNQLNTRLSNIPEFAPVNMAGNVQGLIDLQPSSLRDQVLTAYALSIRTIWICLTPLAFLGLILVLFAKKYTLKRNVVRAGDKSAPPAEQKTLDVENEGDGVQNSEESSEEARAVDEKMGAELTPASANTAEDSSK
jgi:hypothetical protein